MERGAKPAKAKIETKPRAATKSRKTDGSAGGQFEQRLAEALEQQEATSKILRVIRESPTDVQPVYEAIASAALRLFRASLVNVFRFDGELIHLAVVENANVNAEYFAAIHSVFPRPPGRDTAVGRAVLERSTIAIPDVLEDREYGIGAQTLIGGFRSVLGVPLMREEHVIGAIVVCLLQPGQFPESQVALLQTFADQAVIAIENVRLFNETKEALEQQTATSEILRVISQSQTDAQPVFDTIAAAALEAVPRQLGERLHVRRRADPVGGARRTRTRKYTDALRQIFPRPPAATMAVSARDPDAQRRRNPDVLEDRGLRDRGPPRSPAASAASLAVPLIRDGQPDRRHCRRPT